MEHMEVTVVTGVELATVERHDQVVVDQWLHGRSEHTQRAYRGDVERLLSFTGKPLQLTTLLDLQSFADSLTSVSSTSKTRILNAVKSLLSFAHTLGYVPFNVGAALKPPKVRTVLAQRILTEEQVIKMVSLETDKRNHAILRLLYHAGLRVSEIVGLKWEDVIARTDAAQLSVWGKGEKERQVLISQSMYDELLSLDGRFLGADRYVFQSRKGKAGTAQMDTSQVNRIVTGAAKRAGIQGNVSPHWLRHAHASHAIDRGTNITEVRDTLGHASLATTGKYLHARPNTSSALKLPL
jgi:integrase/recombinase XerD